VPSDSDSFVFRFILLKSAGHGDETVSFAAAETDRPHAGTHPHPSIPPALSLSLVASTHQLRSSLALELLAPPEALWDRAQAPVLQVSMPIPEVTAIVADTAAAPGDPVFARLGPLPLSFPVPANKIHSVRVQLEWIDWAGDGIAGRVSVVAAPPPETSGDGAGGGDSGDPSDMIDGGALSSRVPPWQRSCGTRKVCESSLLVGEQPRAVLSFPAPRREESYHLWFEFAEGPVPAARISRWADVPGAAPPTRYLRSLNFTEGEVSVLIFDDPERSLSKCHSALSKAGALTPLPPAGSGADGPPAHGLITARSTFAVPAQRPARPQPPPVFLTRLLVASCRILRRQLDTPRSGTGGDGRESPGATLASEDEFSSSQKAAAPELAAGSEISQIFEAAGVAFTAPSLRAVEELVEENVKRHDERRARSDRIRLEAGQQQQEQQAPLRLNPVLPLPPLVGNNDGDIIMNYANRHTMYMMNNGGRGVGGVGGRRDDGPNDGGGEDGLADWVDLRRRGNGRRRRDDDYAPERIPHQRTSRHGRGGR
jgi:hypothetical protein